MTHALDGFDWDEGNRLKCAKHGVALADVEAVFRGEPAIWPDLEHSWTETRTLAIGRGHDGRYVFVAFTIRERDGGRFIRPISARYMHSKEIDHYEKTRSHLGDR